MKVKKKFYAVRKGHKTGIFHSWDQCKEQVHGFKGAEYKSFPTEEEAQNYMGGGIRTTLKGKEDLLEGECIAYVDGSFDASNHSFSYGMVLEGKDWKEEDSLRLKEEEMSSMRNVAGEIYGAMAAMKRALELGMKKLYLHYDYAGIAHWAKGEWKRNKKGTIEYKAYYDTISDRLDVEFIKVAAHTGIEGNERADQLAKEAVEKA